MSIYLGCTPLVSYSEKVPGRHRGPSFYWGLQPGRGNEDIVYELHFGVFGVARMSSTCCIFVALFPPPAMQRHFADFGCIAEALKSHLSKFEAHFGTLGRYSAAWFTSVHSC